jgi:hypothetical protein
LGEAKLGESEEKGIEVKGFSANLAPLIGEVLADQGEDDANK